MMRSPLQHRQLPELGAGIFLQHIQHYHSQQTLGHCQRKLSHGKDPQISPMFPYTTPSCTEVVT